MTVRERMSAYQEFKGLSDYAIEKLLGKSKGYWHSCKNPTAGIIQLFLSVFPDVSAEWLLRGKEPMLLTAARGSAPATFTTHNDFSHRDGDQVQGDKIEVSGSGNSIKPQSPDPSTTIEALLKLNADLVSIIKSQQ